MGHFWHGFQMHANYFIALDIIINGDISVFFAGLDFIFHIH